MQSVHDSGRKAKRNSRTEEKVSHLPILSTGIKDMRYFQSEHGRCFTDKSKERKKHISLYEDAFFSVQFNIEI